LLALLLSEAGILALLGGFVGTVLSYWGIQGLLALSPAGLPRTDNVVVDGRVALFALCLTGLSELLFGLAPAVKAMEQTSAANELVVPCSLLRSHWQLR